MFSSVKTSTVPPPPPRGVISLLANPLYILSPIYSTLQQPEAKVSNFVPGKTNSFALQRLTARPVSLLKQDDIVGSTVDSILLISSSNMENNLLYFSNALNADRSTQNSDQQNTVRFLELNS
jgi:hypothetical protein